MRTAPVNDESIRSLRRGRRGVRELLAGVVPSLVAAAATFLLGCPQSFVPVAETAATAEARAGSEEDSVTDSESALAEAALMAARVHGRAKRILVPRTLHPVWRKVARTITRDSALHASQRANVPSATCPTKATTFRMRPGSSRSRK